MSDPHSLLLISTKELEAIERRLKAIGRTSQELVQAAIGGTERPLSSCKLYQLRYLNSALDRWERRRRKR